MLKGKLVSCSLFSSPSILRVKFNLKKKFHDISFTKKYVISLAEFIIPKNCEVSSDIAEILVDIEIS